MSNFQNNWSLINHKGKGRGISFWFVSAILCLLFLFENSVASGQGSSSVTVRNIEISGNKKTRDYIVLREIDFKVGDTIPIAELAERFERNEFNLINTSLFNEAVINISEWDTDVHIVDISIKLREAWYIYVVPIMELADRNFNVWWNEYNGALNRLNLGVRAQHLNLTGHNDRLKFLFQFGVTIKNEVEYVFPFLNKKKNLGLSVSYLRSTNKETNYINEGNKLLFADRNEELMLVRNRIRTNLKYRPNLYAHHDFKLEFQNNSINDLISNDLNPDYFLDSRTDQRFLTLQYQFTYDQRDSKIYPLEGFRAGFELEKRGLGIWNDLDQLIWRPYFEKYFRPKPWLSFGSGVQGKWSLIRGKAPYYNNRGLGYGNKFVRGYELYVMDGLDFFVMKNGLKFKFYDKKIDLGSLMFIQQFRVMPVRLYLALNYDVGYANDPYETGQNDLTNRWIYGGGPALNLVLYNNFLFQFEYSWNHLGESGIFVHNKVSF